jgi:hypothetical protein
MSINHVAAARVSLARSERLEAQVHATLALVEEQRTANLIARAILPVLMTQAGLSATGSLASLVRDIDARLDVTA